LSPSRKSRLDPQHAAPAVPADRHRDQHRLAADDPCLPHPLVAGIQDQVGVGLLEAAAGELGQAHIQPLVDRADAGGGEAVTAQLLGDRLDLPRRDPLHVHLGQSRHQRPLRTLVALEQLGGKPAVTILRHTQLQLADPRHQRSIVVPGPIAEPFVRPLTFGRADRLGHLGLQHLLQRRAHERPDKIRVRRDQRLEISNPSRTILCGHGVQPCQGR
jgi:hypothetical protein